MHLLFRSTKELTSFSSKLFKTYCVAKTYTVIMKDEGLHWISLE